MRTEEITGNLDPERHVVRTGTEAVLRTPQRVLALQGRGIFVRASMEYPADTEDQSTRIAELCIRYNLDPLALKEALYNAPDILEKIRQDAIAEHRRFGRITAPKKVTLYAVESIVAIDFGDASTKMLWSAEDFDYALARK